jgi:hypothetical protein
MIILTQATSDASDTKVWHNIKDGRKLLCKSD